MKGEGSAQAFWQVKGDTLGCIRQDGGFEVPPAEAIYEIAVESNAISGAFAGPISTDAQIAFSEVPLSLEVRIVHNGSALTTGLGIEILVVGQGDDYLLERFSDRVADHVIINGVWYPFIAGQMEEVRRLLADLAIEVGKEIGLNQYLRLLQSAESNPTIRDCSQGFAAASLCKAGIEDFIPNGFVGDLYQYQKDGLKWLGLISMDGPGGILADEMGLGKTVQLAALMARELERDHRPNLIVAPGTLLENWRRELARFVPSARVTIHRGEDRTGFPQDLARSDAVVTSYDTLVRDASLFRAIEWNLAILDEAQAIKNPATKRANAIKRLHRRVGLAVTGTPLENRLTDLWSISDFAVPSLLGPQDRFERTFLDNEDGASRLEPYVSPIMLRRRLKDVGLELPGRIDVPQALELPEAQVMEYERIRLETLAEYGPSGGLVSISRLRMYCAHRRLIVGAGASDLCDDSPKYLRLVELLEEITENNEKVIVFTSFVDMADLLVSDLASRFSIPVTHIDGRVAIDERQTVVDQFASVQGSAVLVLNPKAAGTGLNITAANHVVHYNLEWNPAVEDQASARAYRRGQDKPVTVHRLFYIGTVEEVVDARVQVKRSLSSLAVVGTDGLTQPLPTIAAALAMSPVRAGRVPNAN